MSARLEKIAQYFNKDQGLVLDIFESFEFNYEKLIRELTTGEIRSAIEQEMEIN